MKYVNIDFKVKYCMFVVCLKVMDQIETYGIQIYPLPDCDGDEDEEYKEQCRQLKVSVTNSRSVLLTWVKNETKLKEKMKIQTY